MRSHSSAQEQAAARSSARLGADLPPHLKGSRQAIFHLLRDKAPQPPKEPLKLVQPVADTPPKRHRLMPDYVGMVQSMCEEDQFIFASEQTSGVTVSNFSVTRKRLAS